MPREYGTHLYLIQAGEVIKIGRSMDVPRRFVEVKRSMPFADCRLVATFPDSGFIESWVLKAMSAYERRGEWFRASPHDGLAHILECLVPSTIKWTTS